RDGNTITATEIKVENDNEDDDHDEDNDHDNNSNGTVEREGAISDFSGNNNCPNVTFTVQSTKISANGSTSYGDGSCSTLKNGVRVDVRGTKQSDGSITATRIEFDD